MDVDLADCVMVGDFVFDMIAANRAGIPAVLVRGRGCEKSWDDLADFSYATVGDLVEALRSFPSQP
jgi:phosphoglycolate phosphatase-like HAD superfamily hydrolase